MSDLFRSLSGGIARFVLGWLVPSAVTVGLFVLVVGRDLAKHWTWLQHAVPAGRNDLIGLGVFTLAVLTLAMVFAYGSLPIYRLLEGYSLPTRLARLLERRQLRRWHEARVLAQRTSNNKRVLLAKDRLTQYPERREWILPTRLGNALKALETYGVTHYDLDSQALWYELQAAIPAQLRRDMEDDRATVDFFISSVAHLSLLSVTSAICVTWVGLPAAILSVFSAALVWPAYLAAVNNMGDWDQSVRAAVNVGRKPLAESLGLALPGTMQEELVMWANVSNFVSDRRTDTHLRLLNASKHVS